MPDKKKICNPEKEKKRFESRGRLIVVDGKNWRWKIFRNGKILIYGENNERILAQASKMLGYSYPDSWYEDNHWNQSPYSTVTNKHIRQVIKDFEKTV